MSLKWLRFVFIPLPCFYVVHCAVLYVDFVTILTMVTFNTWKVWMFTISIFLSKFTFVSYIFHFNQKEKFPKEFHYLSVCRAMVKNIRAQQHHIISGSIDDIQNSKGVTFVGNKTQVMIGVPLTGDSTNIAGVSFSIYNTEYVFVTFYDTSLSVAQKVRLTMIIR